MVLISSSRGPRGGGARLYRGSLDGGRLEAIPGLGPLEGNIDTHCLAIAGGAWFVGHGSSVWTSSDEGGTWDVVADGLPRISSLG